MHKEPNKERKKTSKGIGYPISIFYLYTSPDEAFEVYAMDVEDAYECLFENERLMKEFLKKGGKVEKIPYGITSQDLGVGNRNAFWDPPKTSTPKAWRRRETMKKKKK